MSFTYIFFNKVWKSLSVVELKIYITNHTQGKKKRKKKENRIHRDNKHDLRMKKTKNRTCEYHKFRLFGFDFVNLVLIFLY